jgi:hypothetical protein
MQSGNTSSRLVAPHWAAAFIGTPVDDRGTAAVEFAGTHSDLVLTTTYDPHTLELSLDNGVLNAGALGEYLRSLGEAPLLVEATTLGFVEIFLICNACREAGGRTLYFLYTEPARYRVPQKAHVLHKRDFGLSDEVQDFSGVPGSTILLRGDNPARGVFLVGYEGQRLDQALEQTALRPSECAVVFGVPAFQPGWEMDSFANNIRVLRDWGLDELLYAGAQNPSAAYEVLDQVRRSCRQDQRMIVAPIGTKPHGIGAAVFACDYEDVGLLYDHPLRSQGRSSAIAQWHLFSAELAGQ